MLSRLITSLVVGVVVFLACILLGTLLVTINVSFVITVGAFLKDYAELLGLLAALWHMFSGGFTSH